ncbi:MAG: hypothetical protein ACLP8S_19845 [Solirubrobacteraceae bacterium]
MDAAHLRAGAQGPMRDRLVALSGEKTATSSLLIELSAPHDLDDDTKVVVERFRVAEEPAWSAAQDGA